MKAVVLSGGQGTRLRPLTYSVPKQLIPVGGRPVLARVLDDIVACGISEIAVVTSPESESHVSELLDGWTGSQVHTQVVIQPEPNGLAAAFKLAMPFAQGDSCLLYLGDCLVTGGIRHVIEEHEATGAAATILVKEVDDPSRYGIVELGADGGIVRLVEKPSEPAGDLAVVGVYVFEPGISDVLDRLRPSWRGEYEITDALQGLVDSGDLVRPSRLRGWWIDTGTVDDVLTAHALLLDGLAPRIIGRVEETSITGAVEVGEDAVVRRSEIRGPVIVGTGVVIEDTQLGPGTAIGRNARVLGSTIKGSIVMDDVIITSATLERSIVGPRTVVSTANSQAPLSLIVGADSRVEMSPSQEG